MYNYWFWAQSRLSKSSNLGDQLLKIDFLKIIKWRQGKMYQKFYSKLIGCLGTYFSVEICQ